MTRGTCSLSLYSTLDLYTRRQAETRRHRHHRCFPCRTERARQWCTAGQGLPAYTVPSSPSISSSSSSLVKPCPRHSWATRRLPFDPFTVPSVASSCTSARMRASACGVPNRRACLTALAVCRYGCAAHCPLLNSPAAVVKSRQPANLRQPSFSNVHESHSFMQFRCCRLAVYNAILTGNGLSHPRRRVCADEKR